MSDSAVRAESVKTGVVNDERFENLSANVHGFGGLRGINQDSENAAERQRLLESGDADWLIPYLKMEPETAQLQPAELRSLAVIRHMEIRGGSHSRVKEYLQLGNDLQTAIMKGEAATARSEDSADYAPTETGIERKPRDSYLGSSLPDLMDTNLKVSGHGRSSKPSRRGRKPKYRSRDSDYQEAIAQYEMRPEVISGRVSELVKAYIMAGSANASAGEILESVVGSMIASGCGLKTIEQWIGDQISKLETPNAA